MCTGKKQERLKSRLEIITAKNARTGEFILILAGQGEQKAVWGPRTRQDESSVLRSLSQVCARQAGRRGDSAGVKNGYNIQSTGEGVRPEPGERK